MFIVIRFISALWGILVTCIAIEGLLWMLNDGKMPTPISYHQYTKALIGPR